jgi:hypothetical protein
MALGASQSRTEVTYLIRGDQLRVDMPGGGGMTGYVVLDAGKNVTTMVMRSQRMYMDLGAIQAMMPGAAQAAKTPDIKPTGKKETVAGIECEHVIVTAKEGQYDVCGAKGLGSFASLPSPMNRGNSGPPGLDRLGKDFFPLKMQKVGGDVVMQVTKIEKKSLDASMFAIPEGYQKMEMPGRP